MSWVGRSEDLKRVLSEAGAEFRWSALAGSVAYRIGPELPAELPEREPGVMLPIPITPVLGRDVVQVHDFATYYVQVWDGHADAYVTEERKVMPLLEGVPEWSPSAVQDVIVSEARETFDV